MNERIALYRDKMKVFWNNRKKGQKIALIAAPLAAILVISLASVFLNQDKFVLSLRTETYNRYITEKYSTTQFYQRTDTRYQNLFILFGLSWKFGKKEVRMPVTQQAATE